MLDQTMWDEGLVYQHGWHQHRPVAQEQPPRSFSCCFVMLVVLQFPSLTLIISC